MTSVINVLVILIFWQSAMFQNELPKNKPLFLSMKKEELVTNDTTLVLKAKGKKMDVDAVTAATVKEIKASTVEGAIYSSHTIWHLSHGAVSSQIQDFLQTFYSDSLKRYFLYSGYEDYYFFALKQLDQTDFSTYLDQVMDIFKKGKPLTRTYILKKFPNELWREKAVATSMYNAFSYVDINSKTMLVKKAADADPIVFEILSNQIEEMSKNQLKYYLDYFYSDKSRLNQTIRNNFLNVVNSKAYTYSYLVEEFLSD